MSIYEIAVQQADGATKSLEDFRGKPLLIVNTASKCGFTPQYTQLQELYDAYHTRGLEILAFPCDQFGHQEPGTDVEIQQFCQLNYGLTFPVFAKIEVNGSGAHPLYQHLRAQRKGVFGDAIKWNFTKFLVNGSGDVVQRYAPTTNPADLAQDIERLL